MSHAEAGNAAYDDALTRGAFDGDRSLVLDGMLESGLHWEGRPICSVLRPLLVDVRENARHELAASRVARGIAIAAEHVARHPEARALLRLTAEEEECVRFEQGDTEEFLGRLDGFVDGEGRLEFIEYNPFASGFAFADGVADRFESTAAFRECAGRVSLERGRLVAFFVSQLLERTGHRASRGPLRLGIVTTNGPGESLLAVPETAIIFQALAAADVEVRTSTLDALAFRGGRLEMGGARIDAVVVTSWDELFAPAGRSSPLWAAVRARSVLVLNGTSSGILRGTKALFTLLSDPAFEALFPVDVRDALRAHVPWTRCVVEGKTTYRGERIDLLRHLRAERRQLVLKPANGYGAIGVVLGWECSEAKWDEAIEQAVVSPYVAQERVGVREMPFPVVGPGGLEWRTFFLDWNPFVWNGHRVHGALSRLCEQPIMNIQAGASSLVPVYTVAQRAAGQRQ